LDGQAKYIKSDFEEEIISGVVLMGNMKDGDVYVCGGCSLEVTVSNACDEEQCDLVCCGNQLTKKEQ